MSFVFKNQIETKAGKLNYLSYKTWRYLYLLTTSSAHKYAFKKHWGRASRIPNAFIGDDFIIHSGKRWHTKIINNWMVGFRLGEFTWNRRLALYKAKQLRKKLLKLNKAKNKKR